MKLLDSNTIIHYLKGNASVIANFQAARPFEIAIPAIVLYEIEFGTLKSRVGASRKKMIADLILNIEHVPFDADAARSAARIRFELEARGIGMGPLDTLIAGIAVSRKAALITSNLQEFSRVDGLRLENWRERYP